MDVICMTQSSYLTERNNAQLADHLVGPVERRLPRERQTTVRFALSPWAFLLSHTRHISDLKGAGIARWPCVARCPA